MTPEIIKSMFRKTGLWPFSQDVVLKEDMAPSKETSCEGHLLATTAPEVAMLAKLMQDMSIASQVSTAVATALAEGDESNDTNAVSMGVAVQAEEPAAALSAVAMIKDAVDGIEVPSTSSTMSSASAKSSKYSRFANYNPTAAIQSIIDEMSTGSLAHLISITNLSSNTDLPPQSVGAIPLLTQTSKSFTSKTSKEREILQALKESEERERVLLRCVHELQATNILNNLYCAKIRGQLAHHKKKKGKKTMGRLMGDGLPILLSDDVFYEKVVEFEARQCREAQEKEAKRQGRAALAGALLQWKRDKEARKIRNKGRHEMHQRVVAVWEDEKKAAKAAKKVFKKLKPKQKALESPISRPEATRRTRKTTVMMKMIRF